MCPLTYSRPALRMQNSQRAISHYLEEEVVTALKTLGPIRTLALVLAFASAAPALADGLFQFFPVPPCGGADTRNAPGVNGGV